MQFLGGLPLKGGMVVQPQKENFASPSTENISYKFGANRLIITIY